MKRFTFFFLLSIFLFLFAGSSYSQIRINEFMQSNIDLVRDDLNDFPDSWVELYNTTNASVDLRNWILSDVNDPNKGWVINSGASQTIPANGYLLLYCDKQDVAIGLHATFRLESGNNGGIYLYNASKQLVSSVTGNDMPKQPAPNISRGLTSGGTWAWFVEATPRAANTTKTATQLLPNPVFSIKGGVYRSTQTLTLSLPANAPSGSAIYYTTNGDEPTSSSTRYTNPVSISAPTSIRAKIIHSDYLTNRSVTHTFIIESTRNFTLPIVSINLNPEYWSDNKFGIHVQGTNGGTANYTQDWRRPMNVEYFPSKDSEAVLNQLGELRIAGGYSRQYTPRSLILYSNKRFGENKRYDYPLFPRKGGQEIKSFMLRNSGNDANRSRFRDAAMQLFFGGKVDVDYQEFQPVAVYLNGSYSGLLNLRERSTDDFVLANYATEDIDMIENWGYQATAEVKAGDKIAFNELLAELKRSTVNYQWLYDHVDIDEFINYMILQSYVGNNDFPHNNVVLWKPRTGNGKWRFVLKDLDSGMGLNSVQPDPITRYMGNTDDKLLFTKLLDYAPFKKEYYSRFAAYMGNLLHPTTTTAIIDSIQDLMEPEMTYHFSKNGGSVSSWKSGQITPLKTWINSRNTTIYSLLKSNFQILGAIIPVKLSDPGNNQLSISINNAVLINKAVSAGNLFDGSFFVGETLVLRFKNDDIGSLGWEIEATVNGFTQTAQSPGREFSYTIPTGCTNVRIRVLGHGAKIREITNREYTFSVTGNSLSIGNIVSDVTISIYDVSGKPLYIQNATQSSVEIPLPQGGIYIVRIKDQNSLVTQKIRI